MTCWHWWSCRTTSIVSQAAHQLHMVTTFPSLHPVEGRVSSKVKWAQQHIEKLRVTITQFPTPLRGNDFVRFEDNPSTRERSYYITRLPDILRTLDSLPGMLCRTSEAPSIISLVIWSQSAPGRKRPTSRTFRSLKLPRNTRLPVFVERYKELGQKRYDTSMPMNHTRAESSCFGNSMN